MTLSPLNNINLNAQFIFWPILADFWSDVDTGYKVFMVMTPMDNGKKCVKAFPFLTNYY